MTLQVGSASKLDRLQNQDCKQINTSQVPRWDTKQCHQNIVSQYLCMVRLLVWYANPNTAHKDELNLPANCAPLQTQTVLEPRGPTAHHSQPQRLKPTWTLLLGISLEHVATKVTAQNYIQEIIVYRLLRWWFQTTTATCSEPFGSLFCAWNPREEQCFVVRLTGRPAHTKFIHLSYVIGSQHRP